MFPNLPRKIDVTSIYDRNFDSKKRIIVNQGGARSSKSYSIHQLFIWKLTNEKNKKFLVTRKTMPALRVTAYSVLLQLLKEYGYYQYCKHYQSSPLTIEYLPNNNHILFVSIDDPDKIKSTGFNYIHMEEAEDFTWEDFVILDTRLSAPTVPGELNQIFVSFNPGSVHGWLNTKLLLRNDIELIKSTYRDNLRHLDKEYIAALEKYRDEDPEYWAIYGLGEYAEIKELIYRPFTMLDSYPADFPDAVYGLDFGYNSESALVEVGIKDQEYYTRELLYEKHLTNQDLIERLKELIPPDKRLKPIYADCEDPSRIAEIYKAGYNCKPCIKGKGSVKNGIDYLKRQRIYTLAGNVNLNRERMGYKWKKDKNGNVLDEPMNSGGNSAGIVKDHGLDALRYAIYTHTHPKVKVGVW